MRAKVLDVDPEKERISLGIKQLGEDPFQSSAGAVKKGEVVTCTVTAITDGGLEVEVSGMAGFIRRAELSRDRSEQRPDRYAKGDRVDARITNIDQRDRKLTLSIKQKEVAEEKQAMAEYGSSDSGASLGDILGAALNKARQESGDDAASDEDVASGEDVASDEDTASGEDAASGEEEETGKDD